MFAGGLKSRTSQHIDDAAFELVKLSMIATAPVIIAWAMIKVEILRKQASPSSPATPADIQAIMPSITALSRGTAIILVVVYALWVMYRRVTDRRFFEAADSRALDLSLQSRRVASRRLSRARQAVFAAALAACFVATVFCCRYIVGSVGAVVAASASLHRHFIGSIVLPMIVNLYNYIKASEIACRGRDVSLSIHQTYGAGASNMLLTLPLLVLVGWASGHPLLFNFEDFDVAILAGGVWATSVLLTSHVDYFRGFVYLTLFVDPVLLPFDTTPCLAPPRRFPVPEP